MHKVLVNPLGALSLPRKSVIRLTDHPDMAFDVYNGDKTTTQQQQGHRQVGHGFLQNFRLMIFVFLHRTDPTFSI